MKKNTFLVVVIASCIGFSCINVIKSGIRDLRFLLTMSSETLANAEAIDGEGEGEETEENTKKYIRYWDLCTFYVNSEYTVKFGKDAGVTLKPGMPGTGLEGKVKNVGKNGRFRYRPNSVACADREKPDGEPMAEDIP